MAASEGEPLAFLRTGPMNCDIRRSLVLVAVADLLSHSVDNAIGLCGGLLELQGPTPKIPPAPCTISLTYFFSSPGMSGTLEGLRGWISSGRFSILRPYFHRVACLSVRSTMRRQSSALRRLRVGDVGEPMTSLCTADSLYLRLETSSWAIGL